VLAQQPAPWLHAVQDVAIDMCRIYASAVRRMLPKAMLVVDLFHVVQLAVKMTVDMRRRVARAKYGRRGRSGDPEYSVKRLLGGNVEDLSGAQFAKIIETLAQASAAPVAGRSDRTGRLTAIAPVGLRWSPNPVGVELLPGLEGEPFGPTFGPPVVRISSNPASELEPPYGIEP